MPLEWIKFAGGAFVIAILKFARGPFVFFKFAPKKSLNIIEITSTHRPFGFNSATIISSKNTKPQQRNELRMRIYQPCLVQLFSNLDMNGPVLTKPPDSDLSMLYKQDAFVQTQIDENLFVADPDAVEILTFKPDFLC